jgi:hypothetical protein
MKLVLAAAVLAGGAATVATVWIGAEVREETVVASPWAEGLKLSSQAARPARGGRSARVCDAGLAVCSAPLGAGGEVTLELAPRRVRTNTELAITVALRGVGAAPDVVKVAFTMDGMEMGRNEVRLTPAGDGRHVGKGVLVRCASGRKDWTAEVIVEAPGTAVRTARFHVAAEE